ncbi:hypothetical protein Dimus_038749 [Dionaea muscipula]
MTLEDQNGARAALDTSSSRNSERRNETRHDGPDRRGRQEKRYSGRDFCPRRFDGPKRDILPWIGNETRTSVSQNPQPSRPVAPLVVQTRPPPGAQVKSAQWCDYHKQYGHGTEECRVLKSRLDAKDKTENQPARRPPADNCKAPPKGKRDRRRSPDPPSKKHIINNQGGVEIDVIHGGNSSGGDSNWSRKRYARGEHVDSVASTSQEIVEQPDVSLVFIKEDEAEVKYPHHDVILVTALIKHVQVQRILIDSGSSADILYYDAYKRLMNARSMRVDQLAPVLTPLSGFTGHSIRAKGEIILPLTVGDTDVRTTLDVKWLVVDAPSAYNAILGRPTQVKMRTVIFPYHLMLKFLVRGKVGKMFGDQETARKCYLVSLASDSKTKSGDKTDSDDDETPGGIHCVEGPPEERAQPVEPLEEVFLIEGDARSVV